MVVITHLKHGKETSDPKFSVIEKPLRGQSLGWPRNSLQLTVPTTAHPFSHRKLPANRNNMKATQMQPKS